MRNLIQQVYRSSGFYPMSSLWIASCVVLALAINGNLGLLAGAFVVSFVFLGGLLISTRRELDRLREKMDGQQTELLSHIDNLEQLLLVNGITPPSQGPKERSARIDEASKEGFL